AATYRGPSCCPSRLPPRAPSIRSCSHSFHLEPLPSIFFSGTAAHLRLHAGRSSRTLSVMSQVAIDPRGSSNPTLLLVDDDETLRERLARAFRDRGMEVLTAASYEEAVRLATAQSPELAVVDLRMPGRGGMELVQALKGIDPTTRIVVLTGYGSIATAIAAVRLRGPPYPPQPAGAAENTGAV